MAASRELVYKGHPLRRKDNIIYFGSMADKYIIMMQILETKKVEDLDVATKVAVQLQLTDPDLRSRDRVVKKSEKDLSLIHISKTATRTSSRAGRGSASALPEPWRGSRTSASATSRSRRWTCPSRRR